MTPAPQSCHLQSGLICASFGSMNDHNRPIEWAWHLVSVCHLQLLNFVCFDLHIDFAAKNEKRKLNHGLTQDITL